MLIITTINFDVSIVPAKHVLINSHLFYWIYQQQFQQSAACKGCVSGHEFFIKSWSTLNPLHTLEVITGIHLHPVCISLPIISMVFNKDWINTHELIKYNKLNRKVLYTFAIFVLIIDYIILIKEKTICITMTSLK